MKRGAGGVPGRIDANQPEIVRAFESLGVSVLDCSQVGCGFPDLIVGALGVTRLVEVKNPENHYGRRGLNKRQQLFADGWRGDVVHIVRTVDDVIALVKAWRTGR